MIIVASDKGVFTLDDGGQQGAVQFPRQQNMAMAVQGKCIAVALHKKGVQLSRDAGQTWVDISPGLAQLDVRALAFDPHEEGVLYAGTEPAAVNRYCGGDWQALGDLQKVPESKDWSFPVPPKVPHVRCITPCPSIAGRLYAMIEVGSLLLSEDGGQSWRALNGLAGHDLHRLVVHPSKPQVLLAATGTDTGVYRSGGAEGVYRSEDGGESWANVNDGLEHRLYAEDAIAFWPDDPDTVLVAAADGIPPHWASMGQLVKGIFSGNVYFLKPSRLRRFKGADVTVYRSQDGGKNWRPVAEPACNALFDMVWALESGPGDDGAPAVYFGTTSGDIRVSRDQGESWQLLASNLGAITHLHPISKE